MEDKKILKEFFCELFEEEEMELLAVAEKNLKEEELVELLIEASEEQKMIEVDYIIRRDEMNALVEYIPNEKIKTVPNLALIEGPNSSGKSSLLNIIAFAFGGRDSKLISESLKRKMDTIITDMDNNHQQSELALNISYGDTVLSFKKESKNNNISIRKDGRPLTKDNLEKQFEIIYDIPEAPTDRLKSLTSAIDSNQEQYEKKIQKIKDVFVRIQKEVDDSRNEAKISELQTKVSEDKETIEDYTDEITAKEAELWALQRFIYNKELGSRRVKVKRCQQDVNEMERKCKSTGRKKATTKSKSKEQVLRNIEKIEDKVADTYDCLSQYVKNDEKLSYYRTHDLSECLTTYEFDKRFEDIAREYKTKLEKERDKLDNKEVIATETLVNDILRILFETDANLNVPGLDKTVGELEEMLSKVKKNFTNTPKKLENIEDCIEKINDILEDVFDLTDRLIPEYRKTLLEAQSEEDDSAYDEFERKRKKLEKVKKEYETLKNESLLYQIREDLGEEERLRIREDIMIRSDYQDIRTNSFEKNKQLCETEKKAIEERKSLLGRVEERQQRYLGLLEEAEKKEKHKYAGKEAEIEKVLNRCNSILRKMQKYNRFIRAIEDSRPLNEEGFEKYNDSVSIYLGNLMGSIRHIDNTYTTKKIDILKHSLETVDGKVILFSEMGTGQSQSAYLLSQLSNLEKSNKKVVVLFDEIETMDKQSLKPIQEKMLQMYKQGILIAGIMVKKGDDQLKVISMEG